jgi:hypothetical protein
MGRDVEHARTAAGLEHGAGGARSEVRRGARALDHGADLARRIGQVAPWIADRDVIDGQEVGLYQVCDATGTTLKCGEWTRMDTGCAQCFTEPCPCSNPACASVCKPQ